MRSAKEKLGTDVNRVRGERNMFHLTQVIQTDYISQMSFQAGEAFH